MKVSDVELFREVSGAVRRLPGQLFNRVSEHTARRFVLDIKESVLDGLNRQRK